jgi:hypothetical protein
MWPWGSGKVRRIQSLVRSGFARTCDTQSAKYVAGRGMILKGYLNDDRKQKQVVCVVNRSRKRGNQLITWRDK